MAVDIDGILNAIVSHAMASGYFDQVNQHEPKNRPGHGITAGVWVDRVRPAASSGLASDSALMVFNVRLYTSTLQEPQDAIDPEMVKAIDALFTAYIGDFTLGGLIRNVDLRGAEGTPLDGQAGYLEQDDVLYRVFTITLPVVINDAWTEEA
ncbi:hypothetical protein BX265_6189 [Streptomyces sp. TLI_235]|nr:hypothetical protein [Streptomyces sp. TLI_235]PBC71579.1 hypothetical protein BX265_6189 [Streptomyces sp. TLI_235]